MTPPPRSFLIDVSRLIWRVWRGLPATGIDRVCLAYLEYFGTRAQAVIKRRKLVFVLSPAQSDNLREILLMTPTPSRAVLIRALVPALASAKYQPPRSGMTYLNVGHTGLDSGALTRWVTQNRAKAVYLIHDLIPLTHPQFCRAGETEKHARRMVHALGSASGIISNSEDTLTQLTRFARSLGLELPPNTVAWISSYSEPKRVAPITLDRPHFVTVGTIEARKNHLTLLQVWDRLVAEMGEDAPVLAIIGNRGWEAAEAIRRLDRLGPLENHVREISSCCDEELASWIAGARALLMPSFVEGFGLPVIEALDVGTPVIASDLPVYREIVEQIPSYLNPTDINAWTHTIQNFVRENSDRNRQLKAIALYRRPTWENHFNKIEPWLATL